MASKVAWRSMINMQERTDLEHNDDSDEEDDYEI